MKDKSQMVNGRITDKISIRSQIDRTIIAGKSPGLIYVRSNNRQMMNQS